MDRCGARSRGAEVEAGGFIATHSLSNDRVESFERECASMGWAMGVVEVVQVELEGVEEDMGSMGTYLS